MLRGGISTSQYLELKSLWLGPLDKVSNLQKNTFDYIQVQVQNFFVTFLIQWFLCELRICGSMFPQTFITRVSFPNVSQMFPTRKLCFRYTAESFNENPSMQAVAKILRARASELSSNFCEQLEQRPNSADFASTFKLNRTIRYPYL